MRVGVIQSAYIPWRGYFDFIDDVDLFVFYDDVQFSKGGWRNRNKIKTRDGTQWLTVPVSHGGLSQTIEATLVKTDQPWVRKHLMAFEQWYGQAPSYALYREGLETHLTNAEGQSISELNIGLTKWLMRELDITTPLRLSSEFTLQGRSTERLIDLLQQLGATTYLSGPSAETYLDKGLFRAAGIGLEYKSYDYGEYAQQWDGFEGTVSVLDLLFNMGPNARRFLKSQSANERII